MVRRKTSTLLSASLTASSFDGWMMARMSFMGVDYPRSLPARDRGSVGAHVAGVHGVFGELDCVIRLEPLLDVRQHAGVEPRRDVQRFAVQILADLALLDDDLAALDNISRQLEHGLLVGAR